MDFELDAGAPLWVAVVLGGAGGAESGGVLEVVVGVE